jgi:hypothetical protein
LVILEGELIRYYHELFIDPTLDQGLRFWVAAHLQTALTDFRRAFELTESETRFNTLEGRQVALQQQPACHQVTLVSLLAVVDGLIDEVWGGQDH